MLIPTEYLSSHEDWDCDQWNYPDEYGIALQKLPTEEELVAMEAQPDGYALDASIFKGERRFGLRH